MKNILIILVALFILSCEARTENNQPSQEQVAKESAHKNVIFTYSATPRGISVQTIREHEYIYVETGHGVAIIHAEDCSNVKCIK